MAVYGYIFVAQERDHLVDEKEQRVMLEKYAGDNGFVLNECFTEEGASLKKPFRERKSGGRLLHQCQSGDVIFVLRGSWVLSGASDGEKLLKIMRKNSISLYCADLGTNISLKEKRRLTVYEGGAELVANLLAALAICESSKHGEAIRAAKRTRKKLGKYLGGPVPFGWRVSDEGTLVPRVEEQEIIGQILHLRNDRWSYRDISRKLLDEKGIRLSHEGVRRIVSSTRKSTG